MNRCERARAEEVANVGWYRGKSTTIAGHDEEDDQLEGDGVCVMLGNARKAMIWMTKKAV